MKPVPQTSIRAALHEVGSASESSALVPTFEQPDRVPAIRLDKTIQQVAAWLALMSGLTMSTPTSAQTYAVRREGAWTVAPSNDAPSCFLTREYAGEGSTTLLFGLDADGKSRLSVLNENWSIKPQERLALNFRLSDHRYSKQIAIGMSSTGKRGFVTGFAPGFATEFARSKSLDVDRGDVPVARLTLDGSGAALAELKRCVAVVSASKTAGPYAGSRAARVPKDPFSPDLDKRSPKRR